MEYQYQVVKKTLYKACSYQKWQDTQSNHHTVNYAKLLSNEKSPF